MEPNGPTVIRLDLPVPPMLEEALGYAGTARWVAFYWLPGGDELMYDDGLLSADGQWHAWLLFKYHPRIAPSLAPYALGNSEEEARHWLLLDRDTRTVYVGNARAVQQFLRQVTPPVFTTEAVEALLAALDSPPLSLEELSARVAQALHRQHQLEQALQAWLDAQEGQKS
jgi:hypothetical protein